MGRFSASRRAAADPNAIEMGLPSQRMPYNESTAAFSTATSDAYVKKEHLSPDDAADRDAPDTNYQPVDWKHVLFHKKYLPIWITLLIIGILTALISLYHSEVVEVLRPFAEKVREIPAGWLIFVAVLIIISFPPLFGHELVALLAGVVYGLWFGFVVVAIGTFLGEIGTWFAFKKLFRHKAEKMERINLNYGALAQMCRDGGFWMVFMIRLSIIPSHMSTAIFSTCDVKFWHFSVSTFFTLPKQLVLVYMGVLLVGGQSQLSVKIALFGSAGLITVVSAVWIWWKMAAIKKALIAKQDAQRSRIALRRDNSYNNQGSGHNNFQQVSELPRQGDFRAGGAGAGAGAAMYASQFEHEQAEVFAANYDGDVGTPRTPRTPLPDKTYRPANAQSLQPVRQMLPYPDTGGDLGSYDPAYRPLSTSPTTTKALSTPPSRPRYQATVQEDSLEQTTAHMPHRFV